ncbi:MAG: hypothetical protein K1X91_08875 [Bacteriodetes bacterium]|nr:hypothetical protein [Bacteroidota bacterium]
MNKLYVVLFISLCCMAEITQCYSIPIHSDSGIAKAKVVNGKYLDVTFSNNNDTTTIYVPVLLCKTLPIDLLDTSVYRLVRDTIILRTPILSKVPTSEMIVRDDVKKYLSDAYILDCNHLVSSTYFTPLGPHSNIMFTIPLLPNMDVQSINYMEVIHNGKPLYVIKIEH